MRIAMCTENASLFAAVKAAFEEDGISTCVRCADPLSLMKYLARNPVDLVLLDGGRNFAPCRTVFAWRDCQCRDSLPVVVIGQHFDRDGMIDAFDAGANDIVVGPLSTQELLVRAQRSVACGGRRPLVEDSVRLGPYRLERLAGAAYCHDERVPLTPREFAIAWLLFANLGTLLSREQIALAVWGKDFSLVSRTLEQHVYKLRTKLDLGRDTGVELTTVYAQGYRLSACERGDRDAPGGEGAQVCGERYAWAQTATLPRAIAA
jgi:DNA-binding response OmpR family regulator